jgi:GntR family transcriptional regulator
MTLERLRYLNGEAAIYVINHLPERYADVLPEIRSSPTASLYDLLGKQHGVLLTSSSRVLEAVAAPAYCARQLGLRRGSPVAFIQSVGWDTAMTPVDCYRAWVRTDRLRISVETEAWESATGRVVSHSLTGVLANSAGPTEGW